jgi:prepilin-type N-terminal cleavage/methylation domain-containing protein
MKLNTNVNNRILKTRGFTLVETLVAVTILATSVAGVMTIAFQGLRGAQLARDQLTASYLAQEGVDLIRAWRDQNYLADPLGLSSTPGNWDIGFDECLEADGCSVDATQLTSAPADCNVTCPFLNFQESSGLYSYQSVGGWAQSGFRRTITLSSTDPDAYYMVDVTMEWQTGSISRSFTLSEPIMNWQSKL